MTTETKLRELVARNRLADDKGHAAIAEIVPKLATYGAGERQQKQKQIDAIERAIAHRARETASAEQGLADIEFERRILEKKADELAPFRLRAHPPMEVMAGKAAQLLEAMLSMMEVDQWVLDASADANLASAQAIGILSEAGISLRNYDGDHPVPATTYDGFVQSVRYQLELMMRARGLDTLTATQRWNTFISNIAI